MTTKALPFDLWSLSDTTLVGPSVVARALGISERHVLTLVRNERLPHVVVSEGCRRYPVGGLKQWVASRTRNTGKAA